MGDSDKKVSVCQQFYKLILYTPCFGLIFAGMIFSHFWTYHIRLFSNVANMCVCICVSVCVRRVKWSKLYIIPKQRAILVASSYILENFS